MGLENLVMVERDYKGYYERGITTIDDFQLEYPDSGIPCIDSDTDTLRPMVHIWYKCPKSEDEIDTFLSDMEEGLPQCDIDSGNIAYLRKDLFGKELMSLYEKYKTESSI